MACGSRPVKRIPERGAFPTVGIHQRPGVKGAGPFAPLPPPPTAGWQIAIADQGGTGSSQSQIQIPKFRSAIPQPPLVGPRGGRAVAMAERLAGASDGRHDPLRVIKNKTGSQGSRSNPANRANDKNRYSIYSGGALSPSGRGEARILSMRFSSISTTSKRQPSQSA